MDSGPLTIIMVGPPRPTGTAEDNDIERQVQIDGIIARATDLRVRTANLLAAAPSMSGAIPSLASDGATPPSEGHDH
jgi:hypothetical protein